jgi:hypothetical protein
MLDLDILMKISYPTILVLGGLFSVTAIGLSIASFSRRRKVSPSKELQNENKDKVKSISVRGKDVAQTAVGEDGTQVKVIGTTSIGFEQEKVRRVKKYKSNGKPIYE